MGDLTVVLYYRLWFFLVDKGVIQAVVLKWNRVHFIMQ